MNAPNNYPFLEADCLYSNEESDRLESAGLIPKKEDFTVKPISLNLSAIESFNPSVEEGTTKILMKRLIHNRCRLFGIS